MSKRIPPSFIQDVIARTDIVELIESRVQLKKRGHNYLACCPFHQEKTPSFTVSRDKQFYYCFGCGAHGNAISFLMAYDRMEFPDAVADLAAPLNLTVPFAQTDQAKENLTTNYDCMAEVAHYYQQLLRQSAAAIEYLKSRGVTGYTAKKFGLGYASANWEGFKSHGYSNTMSQTQLLANGLLIKKEHQDRYFDRFRDRIMFPIRDARGRVIAFGGRALGQGQPKYMNSPETAIFHKSDELYGLYEALQYRDELKQIVVVEGYMDVITLHQAGLHHVVATLGTATNLKHVQKLLRYTQDIVFCFDGDQAGQQAAWKALTLCLPLLRDGVHLRFLFLPEGEDPDSMMQRIGLTGFKQRLAQAQSLADVFFSHFTQRYSLSNAADKADVAKQATAYLKRMPRGLYRELLLEQLAQQLQVYSYDLHELMEESPQGASVKKDQDSPTHGALDVVSRAIALLLQQPKLAAEAKTLTLLLPSPLQQLPVLVKLVTWLAAEPALNIGEILSRCDEQESRLIAKLAAYRLPLSQAEILAEFRGVMVRLREQHDDYRIQQLIDKSKHESLSTQEKTLLNQLLINQHSDPI